MPKTEQDYKGKVLRIEHGFANEKRFDLPITTVTVVPTHLGTFRLTGLAAEIPPIRLTLPFGKRSILDDMQLGQEVELVLGIQTPNYLPKEEDGMYQGLVKLVNRQQEEQEDE